MSVIAEFGVRAEDFVLGRALQETPELAIELERVIPTGDGIAPYFWVTGEDRAAFEAVLADDPDLSAFEVVDEIGDRALYRVEWDRELDAVVQLVTERDAVLQGAEGDAREWSFQIRFPDAHELSEFHTACREAGLDVSVERLYNPIEPTTVRIEDMTEAQRSLIELSYDAGYFEVPREITLAEIADRLGISGQSVNERLRRGLSTLISATLKTDGDRGD